MTSPFRFALGFAVAALALSGCGKKDATPSAAEPTKAQRAEVAMLLSEAEFAVQLRDHARAEPLLAKAVSIIGDNPDHWIMLGATRRRLGNTDGARQAYRSALAVLEREYKATPADGSLVLEQVYVHALLGQTSQAKSLLDKAVKAHADDQPLQEFVRSKGLEQMMADRGFKEVALP
jgi:Flp pilus assembly protein TadD